MKVSTTEKKNLDTKHPPYGMKRVSQPISNIKKAFSLASLIHIAYHPENPHDFTLQLCLPSALFFSHGKEMQCFTDTIKTVQASTPLWLLNNWMLCLGILMEGIFIGVCVSGYAEKFEDFQ